jgi:predicted SprT family Zn-dependent metalloprotease
MLHEIAHAIDVEIRGMSDHSYVWKSIASSVGARPEGTTDVEINSNNSKYSITCPNGHKSAGHKYSNTIAEGRQNY